MLVKCSPSLFVSPRRPPKMKKARLKSVEANPSGPVCIDKNGNVIIHVLAKPGAKTNSITDISPEGIGVQIASKPVDGEANMELIRYMSLVLGCKRNEISLDKGSKSRQKVLSISNKNCIVNDIIAKIKEEIDK